MGYQLTYLFMGNERHEVADTWEQVAYRLPYLEYVCGLSVTVAVAGKHGQWTEQPRLFDATQVEDVPPFLSPSQLERVPASVGDRLRFIAQAEVTPGLYYARTGGFIYALRVVNPVAAGQRGRASVTVVPVPDPRPGS